MNKVVHFLLTLLIMFAVSIAPAQALLKSGTWQELNSTTGAVNGTAPLADGATIPLYQGSMLLDPTKTYDIEFTAMPRDFSADASSTSMRRSTPPIRKAISLPIRPPSPGKIKNRRP